ncbi:sigma-70 family RNA polymerase sigma factor, partial [Actinokineospora enzanensis]|uniref:sigma-70 family RNA polymerase sigma factor n=1 Tax=Actinokineospora enzanensis TaxID=155975 RepID=UPI0012EB9008
MRKFSVEAAVQLSDPGDADLVERAGSGDDDAFSQLYNRYRLPLTRFLARLTGDSHLAEDLTQEAFVSALRHLSTLRRPSRFRPWLFSIAHRCALDHIRRGGPVLFADPPELAADGDSPQDVADAHAATSLVWDAAASLEPRQLAILELTVRDEVTTAELAHALDVRTSHAAVLAHRARSALGHAVRVLLLARNPRSCRRLANLVPERPRTLSPAQRVSVDRHLRRCPDCRELAGRLTTPLAVLGVLLRDPTPHVSEAAWALVDPSRHLVRKTFVTLALTLVLTALWSLIPHNTIPPEANIPPGPTPTTTAPAIPAVTITPSTVVPTPLPTTPQFPPPTPLQFLPPLPPQILPPPPLPPSLQILPQLPINHTFP